MGGSRKQDIPDVEPLVLIGVNCPTSVAVSTAVGTIATASQNFGPLFWSRSGVVKSTLWSLASEDVIAAIRAGRIIWEFMATTGAVGLLQMPPQDVTPNIDDTA
jgi:hypothetical protein